MTATEHTINEVVNKAADELTSGIHEAASLFAETTASKAGAMEKIAEELRQESGEQTWRMASAIVANAFVFHESVAGGQGKLAKIKSLEELKSKGNLTKSGILNEWRAILAVNYWSIFDIAGRILEHTPGSISNAVIETMAKTVARLLEHRLMRSHDLIGAVFQKLIVDRKFLAAYYTMPASAALLAGLAIRADQSPAGKPWGDTDALKHARIADFACGTGTLLSAAYQRIGQFHEMAGGDASELHSYMMGGSLVGCDVLPAAACLTEALLASVHPTQVYTESSIMTLAYGRRAKKEVALGSIDLMDPQRQFEILEITAKAVSLPHEGFDTVIMNPPFTRDTGQEGKKKGVRNPMFAAFAADNDTQRLMAETLKNLTRGTSAHGNAGEASIFLVLAHRKLKADGTLAMVLPLSFMLGDAWGDSRVLVAKNYRDLILVSNAGLGGTDISFSTDTGTGECLLVGQKGGSSKRAMFVTLNERPDSTISGSVIAERIQEAKKHGLLRKLEDGPTGGTPILIGNEMVGQAVDGPLDGGWNLARVRDFALAQTAFQLVSGRLWLAGMKKAEICTIPVSVVSKVGKIGPYHSDINGRTQNGGIRGPFDIHPVSGAATYPALWAHDAKREYSISFLADSEAIPVKGETKAEQLIIDQKAENVWSTASHCHFNVNFQFGSQATGMQYTPQRTLGGRAWLSIKLKSPDKEKALVLWANTSLGLLLHWWYSNRQQIGRSNIGKSVLKNLVVLDVDKLTDEQLKTAEKVFDGFSDRLMRPMHEIAVDGVRRELDKAVLVDILGLPEKHHTDDNFLPLLRMKLAAEPSVVGHKGRPRLL